MSGFAFDVAAAFLGSFAALLVTAAMLIRVAPKLMRSAMRGSSLSATRTKITQPTTYGGQPETTETLNVNG